MARGVLNKVFWALNALAVLGLFLWATRAGYKIRLYAIETYGRVIHEFDPWFNMRATQYMADNGIAKFFKWYDHESWYPLGRPVGTTIYPGMQLTSVAIWNVLRAKFWKKLLGFSLKMSLNDVCVFVPAWFGAIASVVLGLLTREVSGSWRAAGVSALVMAVIPAHIMRSVGGGYDNESVAMTAMCLTFYLWCRSLRTPGSWPIGILAGLAYAYMVAAWGGFIFVGNMVAIHAALLVATGFYSSSLHKAYSLWYIVGTALAIQVPVVGMSPFKSLEQLGALMVFLVLQLFAVTDELGRRRGFNWQQTPKEMLKIRVYGILAAAAAASVVIAILLPTGYFGPLSVRVRSLFVKHTKTGNPLVDSVAEHQPVSAEAYFHHLHYTYYLIWPGVIIALLQGATDRERKYSGVQVTKWFIVLYAVVAYYFSNKMARLIILLGPVVSALSGIAITWTLEWCARQFAMAAGLAGVDLSETADNAKPLAGPAQAAAAAVDAVAAEVAKETSSKKDKKSADVHPLSLYGLKSLVPMANQLSAVYNHPTVRLARVALAVLILFGGIIQSLEFYRYADMYAHQMSQPSIMFKARLNDGTEVMINDYQEAYWWLRDKTPKDARILAWWDYGYQISGIGQRTTLADGNTWNLEHIALIGRMMTLPEKKAHALARHLADYVLVWAGNQGDDLAKSPHMARISSSVYSDLCPGDPLCTGFGFYHDRRPTPTMAASMLYKMHSNGKPGVSVNPKLFQEVFSSKYGLVRIYKILNISQESKDWLADPANRICDAPGSWYCVGQYPPGLPRPPKTHRTLDYDDPSRYVEEKQGKVGPNAKKSKKNRRAATPDL